MKPHPTRLKGLAAAGLTLALGVSGWWLAKAPNNHTTVVPEQARVVFKSRIREPLDQPLPTSRAGIRMLEALPPSPERDRELVHAVSQWASEAPDEAVAWIADVPSGELRDWLACAIVTAIGENQPAQAATLIDTELPAGLPRNHAIVSLAQRWAQRSPDDARRWLAQLPQAPAHDEALREIAVIEASQLTE
ncbi:MAG: hypothetical protein V4640_12510 [Verrucomicrobiota bacterium]